MGNSGINLKDLWQIVCRRRALIIATFCVVVSLATYLAITLPPIYRSTTVILITPQRLPNSYVGTTVTSTIEQGVKTTAQQILGRSSLEPIIKELNLYARVDREVPMEDRVEKLRKKIVIVTVTGRAAARGRGSDSFELSFEAETPQKAMQVTERLSSLFIEENIRVREQQAAGTTSFINAEAERLRKDLEIQEAQVNSFRAQYRYELPEQLDANLRMLDQFRRELDNGALRLSSLQERKANLEKQLSEMELATTTEVPLVQGSSLGVVIPVKSAIENRQSELAALLQTYSEKHPDVIRLRREIQALAMREKPAPEAQKPAEKSMPIQGAVGARLALKETIARQMQDLTLEMDSLRTVNERLRFQISAYQGRIDNIPLRGIELSKITRNYDITLGKYKELLAKRLESELSENMEKKQKGEQFQVIERPTFPEKPIAPDRPRILFIGLALGLAAGVGVAFLLEKLNTAFNKAEDLDGYIDVPLLAALPAVMTRGTLLERRRAQSMLVIGSVGALAIGMAVIRSFGTSFAGY